MPEERERVAEELRLIREGVRERALLEPAPLATARATRPPEPLPALETVAPEAPPTAPDATAVNAGWDTARAPASGFLGRLVRRALQPFVAAQASWNARQVQLDNALLEYVDARLSATHRHYDRVLGVHGSHMNDVDARHLILQEELVAHVHDLVKRIDLVLAESEKGRLSLEAALRDVRGRLARLEERLARE